MRLTPPAGVCCLTTVVPGGGWGLLWADWGGGPGRPVLDCLPTREHWSGVSGSTWASSWFPRLGEEVCDSDEEVERSGGGLHRAESQRLPGRWVSRTASPFTAALL